MKPPRWSAALHLAAYAGWRARRRTALIRGGTRQDALPHQRCRPGPALGVGIDHHPLATAQEFSREELRESLRDVLREALAFNRIEALEAAGPGAEELLLSL